MIHAAIAIISFVVVAYAILIGVSIVLWIVGAPFVWASEFWEGRKEWWSQKGNRVGLYVLLGWFGFCGILNIFI